MSNIGAKIDNLHNLREAKRAHEKQIEDIKKQIDDLESELIVQLEMEGLTKSTGKLASVSLTEVVRPTVEDWDSFYQFIHKHKYYHLLERRPSVTGCRELFETKGRIPGVVPFTKKSLNIRTI